MVVRPTRRRFLAGAAASLALARPAIVRAAEPLVVCFVPANSIHWIQDVAIDKGFYRDVGFEPQVAILQSSPQSIQGAISGAYHIATSQPEPFVAAVEHGAVNLAAQSAPMNRADWALTGSPSVRSLDDLKGKEVGVVAGAAQDEYARHIGATTVPFQTDAEEFPSIVQGRVKILLEDNVLFYNFIKANPNAPIELVPNVSLPEELILGYGYGYARFATRKEDCTLRAAYTQGLAELRGDGTVSAILKKYGLDPLSNLIYFTPK